MRFGMAIQNLGALATREHIYRMAALAEELGFDSLWLADHPVHPGSFTSPYPYAPQFPYRVEEPMLEALATLGVLAGITRSIRLGVAVIVVPYRNPVLLTKMLTTLDVLSHGRIIFGAGVGWWADEFEALAAPPFKERGRVTNEYLTLYRRLCTEEKVSFQGEFYSLREITLYPKPIQRPHPPIIVGGHTRPAMRRAVRFGDGWIGVSLSPEEVKSCLAVLRECCEEAGRDSQELEIYLRAYPGVSGELRAPDGTPLPGSSASKQLLDIVRRYEEAGVHHLILRFQGDTNAQMEEQARRFVEEVRARL